MALIGNAQHPVKVMEECDFSRMSITGYATSRSRSAAWTRLPAQSLTRATQEVHSAHVCEKPPL